MTFYIAKVKQMDQSMAEKRTKKCLTEWLIALRITKHIHFKCTLVVISDFHNYKDFSFENEQTNRI